MLQYHRLIDRKERIRLMMIYGNKLLERIRLCLLLPLALLLFVTAVAAADEARDPGRWYFDEFYRYDRDLPLNAIKSVEEETDTYTLYRVDYDSAHDKRVPGLLMLPKGADGPVPVIMFMSGYGGNKGDAKVAYDLAATMGYAVLALDAEYHGERKVDGKAMYSKLPYSSRDAMMQTVIDYRRGIDFLEKVPEVDAGRVGFIGGSMGGLIGPVFMAYEPRVRAGVFAVGGADWGYLLKASVVAEALGLNKGEHALDPKTFRRIVAPADAFHSAQLISPRPVLMLNAKHDILVNPRANKYLYARLLPPKKIIWFDDDHELPMDTALDYTMEFYAAYLKGDEDSAAMGAQILGHETAPMDMDLGKPLPPPKTSMPMADLFEYEPYLPLKPEPEVILQDASYEQHKAVSFLSTHDKRVTAEIWAPGPRENGPYPVMIYVHAPGGSRADAMPLVRKAMEAKQAVLAIDVEYHGERARDMSGREFLSPDVYTSRDAMLQTVFDIRRAADFAQSLWPDADVELTLAANGSPMADLALTAAAVDGRFASVSLYSDPPDSPYEAAMQEIRDAGREDEFLDAVRWSGPQRPEPVAPFEIFEVAFP